MTLDKFNAIIDDALAEVAHGQIVNASGYLGHALEEHLRESFEILIELERGARQIAAELFGNPGPAIAPKPEAR